MSDTAHNLYAEPVGFPDPFSEAHRLSNPLARAREICGLQPADLPESQWSGLPNTASDDLIAMYERHQKVHRVVVADEQMAALDLGQGQEMEQR